MTIGVTRSTTRATTDVVLEARPAPTSSERSPSFARLLDGERKAREAARPLGRPENSRADEAARAKPEPRYVSATDVADDRTEEASHDAPLQPMDGAPHPARETASTDPSPDEESIANEAASCAVGVTGGSAASSEKLEVDAREASAHEEREDECSDASILPSTEAVVLLVDMSRRPVERPEPVPSEGGEGDVRGRDLSAASPRLLERMNSPVAAAEPTSASTATSEEPTAKGDLGAPSSPKPTGTEGSAITLALGRVKLALAVGERLASDRAEAPASEGPLRVASEDEGKARGRADDDLATLRLRDSLAPRELGPRAFAASSAERVDSTERAAFAREEATARHGDKAAAGEEAAAGDEAAAEGGTPRTAPSPTLTGPEAPPMAARRGRGPSPARTGLDETTREFASLVRERRQEAATSAVNRMTLRQGAEGQVDLGELGRVTVRATTENGEVDVTLRADDEDTVAMLQSTSAVLESELRRESVEVRHLGVEREHRRPTDEEARRHGRDRSARPDEPAMPEADPGFEADLERSVRFVLSPKPTLSST
jgi:hypothetical protein